MKVALSDKSGINQFISFDIEEFHPEIYGINIQYSELPIRRSNRYNLEIIFHISPNKHIL